MTKSTALLPLENTGYTYDLTDCDLAIFLMYLHAYTPYLSLLRQPENTQNLFNSIATKKNDELTEDEAKNILKTAELSKDHLLAVSGAKTLFILETKKKFLSLTLVEKNGKCTLNALGYLMKYGRLGRLALRRSVALAKRKLIIKSKPSLNACLVHPDIADMVDQKNEPYKVSRKKTGLDYSWMKLENGPGPRDKVILYPGKTYAFSDSRGKRLKFAQNITRGESYCARIGKLDHEAHDQEVEGLTALGLFRGSILTKNKYYIFRDFIPGEILLDVLTNKTPLDLINQLRIVISLLCDLIRIHQAKRFHGDIHPGNIIFVPTTQTAALTDPSYPAFGTTQYVAPELFRNFNERLWGIKNSNPHPDFMAGDIYSLGRNIGLLFNFCKLYDGQIKWRQAQFDPMTEWREIEAKSESPHLTQLKKLYQSMISIDPSKRPTAAACLKDVLEIYSKLCAKNISQEMLTQGQILCNKPTFLVLKECMDILVASKDVFSDKWDAVSKLSHYKMPTSQNDFYYELQFKEDCSDDYYTFSKDCHLIIKISADNTMRMFSFENFKQGKLDSPEKYSFKFSPQGLLLIERCELEEMERNLVKAVNQLHHLHRPRVVCKK